MHFTLKGVSVLSSYGNAGWFDKPDVYAKFRQDVNWGIDQDIQTTQTIENIDSVGTDVPH